MAQQPKQSWRISGFGCCTPASTCCLTFWCPCITFGRTKHRTRHGNLNSYSTCNGSCALWCGLSFCSLFWIPQCMQRGDLREKFNLTGNSCTDCLCSFCCSCCDLMQQEKESKLREEERASLITQQPNVQKDGMTYQPGG